MSWCHPLVMNVTCREASEPPTCGSTDAAYALHTLSYKYICYGVDESFRSVFVSCSMPLALAILQISNSDASSSSGPIRAWMSGDA